MTIQLSAVSRQLFVVLAGLAAVSLGLPPAFRLETRTRPPAPGVSNDVTAEMRRRILGLIATNDAKERYLRPALRPLFDSVEEMLFDSSRKMEDIVRTFSAVDSNLRIADEELPWVYEGTALYIDDITGVPRRPDYAFAHDFCRYSREQLNGGFRAMLDLLATNARTAHAEVSDLTQAVVDGSAYEGQAHKALDDADAILDTRAFMLPATRDLRQSVDARLPLLTLFLLSNARGANEYHCEEPGHRNCFVDANVGEQMRNALDGLFGWVESDPWWDVSLGHRSAVRTARPVMWQLRNEVVTIAQLIPANQARRFERVILDLQTARISFEDANSYVARLESEPCGTGIGCPRTGIDRHGQLLLEAARSMTKALGALVAALRDLNQVSTAPRTARLP